MTKSPKAIGKLAPEQARQNLHLLLLANPNYFGNLQKSDLVPVVNIAADTNYEELGCVGYSATLGRLEAVVSIKQATGYGGGICTSGSQEYVRFYLSFDGGATWQDQGCAGFTVFDIPGPKPLEYVAALPISPPQSLCFFDNLPKVRAILSWNLMPPASTPDFVPIWGNVANVTIQIPGTEFIILGDLLDQAKLKLPDNLAGLVDSSQAVAVAPPKPLSPAQLAEAYKGTTVPPHRSFYSSVLAGSAANALASAPLALSAKNALAGLKLDTSAIVGSIIATSGDTAYEQLDCVGLDLNRSAVAGVVNVKLSSGYSGGPCTAGSTEYVAFWVNWGSGFQYVGTASFATHDFAAIPAEGLDYAVAFPINLASEMQPCAAGAKTATIRGILSWETAPPPTNPDYIPVWGNRLDALVQIPAGQPFVQGTPDIAIIGGIGVGSIDWQGLTVNPGMTTPNALFALTGTAADPWISSRQCPFGGLIVIQGLPSAGSKYRVWAQQMGAPTPTPVTNSVYVTNWLGVGSWVPPGLDGFFTYLDTSQNVDNNLAYWYSSGDSPWYVWLEIADSTDTVFGSTPFYLIQLDNTKPAAEIHIDSGGDCKQFALDTTIDGHFVATDLHFGAFSMVTTPQTLTPPPNEPTTANPATSPTPPWPGAAWSLNTENPDAMPPCGYVIELWVYDNAIVGSGPNSHNSNYADVGFCLISGD
jgi:hypothetical protein